jgi:hypothetical protein
MGMPDSESQATFKFDTYFSNDAYPNVVAKLVKSFGHRPIAESLDDFRYELLRCHSAITQTGRLASSGSQRTDIG